MDGRCRQVGRIDHTALRGHGDKAAAKAGIPQPLLQGGQVAGHDRLQGRVDAGARRPPVLPERGVEAVGEREGHARQMSVQQRADPLFVVRIDDRPEQADPDGLDVGRLEPLDHGADGVLVQRLVDHAVGAHALRHLEGEAARHQRVRKRHGVVEGIDPAALAQQEDVGVSLRGEEGSPRRPPGQHGIGRPRRGVEEELAFAEQGRPVAPVGIRRLLQDLEAALDRIVRPRGRLEEAEGPVPGLQHEVGEGPPHIDGKSHLLPSHDRVAGALSGRTLVEHGTGAVTLQQFVHVIQHRSPVAFAVVVAAHDVGRPHVEALVLHVAAGEIAAEQVPRELVELEAIERAVARHPPQRLERVSRVSSFSMTEMSAGICSTPPPESSRTLAQMWS